MMMIIGETKLKSFAFKGGEVGVDGEVAPPPAEKELGFSLSFSKIFWDKILLDLRKRNQVFLFFFPNLPFCVGCLG